MSLHFKRRPSEPLLEKLEPRLFSVTSKGLPCELLILTTAEVRELGIWRKSSTAPIPASSELRLFNKTPFSFATYSIHKICSLFFNYVFMSRRKLFSHYVLSLMEMTSQNVHPAHNAVPEKLSCVKLRANHDPGGLCVHGRRILTCEYSGLNMLHMQSWHSGQHRLNASLQTDRR